MMEKGTKKLTKKWYPILVSCMVMAILFMIIPLQASAAKTSGTWGSKNGITWVYDDSTQTLTVSGKDMMQQLQGIGKFVSEVKTVVLKDLTVQGIAGYMFYNFTSLEEVKCENFDTSEITDMSGMFSGCSKLISVDLSQFNTSKVKNMASMFYKCNVLKELDLSSFNTANVGDMSNMFADCSALQELDLSSFNTANVTNMYYMFEGCSGLKELDLSNFDTSKVVWMPAMFYKCNSLSKVNLSSFNTSLVTNMSLMFANCTSLTDLDISNFNTANVESMGSMFSGCEKLKELNISGFTTPKLTDMSGMFGDCKNLTELKLDGFDTSKVDSMQVIFYGCSKLTSLDISNFTIGADVNTLHFFTTCKSLKTIKAPKQIADGIQIILPDNYLDSKQKKTSYLNKDFCNTTLTKEANPFGDIKESDWQYYYAKSALNYGVMNGKGTNDQGIITFDPNASMTRAEFVQALYNKEGKPAVTFTNKFSDVTGKEWFASAITWAADKNIVAGKGDKFDVNGKITRQEMATILYKYASFKGYMTTCDNNFEGYTDASTISNWAVEYMKWALDYGIMKGKGTRIAPLENATRAECATMLINFMETYEVTK